MTDCGCKHIVNCSNFWAINYTKICVQSFYCIPRSNRTCTHDVRYNSWGIAVISQYSSLNPVAQNFVKEGKAEHAARHPYKSMGNWPLDSKWWVFVESENHNSEITEQQLRYLIPKAIMCVAQHVILYFVVAMEYFSYLLPGPTPWLASNGGGLLLFGMTQNTQPPFQASALMHSTPKSLSVPANILVCTMYNKQRSYKKTLIVTWCGHSKMVK